MDQMTTDAETPAARSGIQVIARAASVLRALKDTPSGLSLGQIAERTRMPRSTVQRIVAALQDERLVIAAPSGGGVRLGPELHALAGAARFSVVERCRPFLNDLARRTGETVDLSVLRGAGMIFLDQVAGTQRLRTVSAVGEVFPLTVTANGRACLALMPAKRAEQLALAEWARLGVPADLAALRHTLSDIRATGLALDPEAHSAGISAIGFAFADHAGDLHAISVPIPTQRFRERQAAVTQALLDLRPDIARVFSP